MASNIKGITIEISGNTTKLEDALKGVNKQVYSLNSDLKTLDKALQLDPKNTELLAQKYDVLKRNIQETESKLQTLKLAQKQMGDYNKLTDDQKKSYNALSLEIAKSESSLKGMKGELAAASGMKLDGLKAGLAAVGSVALEVAAAIAKITVAIGAALTSVVAMGVKSYASLEQNIGGIETMFKDNSDKVIENAKNAYATIGISANEYMQQATSFSAALINSLGGDTKKAADVADMALMDMADNANKFGTDMASIQNAYQGFAKQNYTMLDNLKLGYGGTKTEMQRLLKDAEKFSGIKYDINNLSDVYNAIHVIQEQMEITGTTAQEANSTITGSLGKMKAAFDNFINGSGSPEALGESISTFLKNVSNAVLKLAPGILSGVANLISDLVPQIIDLIVQVAPQLLDAITSLVDKLLEMVSGDTTALQNTITTLINKIVEFFTSNLPKIIQIGLTLIITLAKAIADSLPTIIPAVVQCVIEIVNTLLDNLDLLIDAVIQLMIGITIGVIDALPILLEKLPDIIVKIVEVLIDNLPKLVEAVIFIIVKLAIAIVENIPKLLAAIGEIVVRVNDKITEFFHKALEWGKNIIIKLAEGIANMRQKVIDKIKEIGDGLVNKIKELPSKMLELGTNLVKGIWNGISNATDWIVKKIKSFGDSVMKAIKKIFGIASPSKVMRDEVGKYLAEGIGVGFENEIGSVENDMVRALDVNSLVNDVNSAMSGVQAGIETSINPQINPNINMEQNYTLMGVAMREALKDMQIELDDNEVGRFVVKTVSNEIYG